jgi:hypothetical protein
MQEALVPVFVPPLANLLAAATLELGRPLVESEVLSVRDKGVCIMMAEEQANHMEASRGFRDVIAEDAWADWHRLEVEMTGQGYLPKLVLGLWGEAGFPERAADFLSRQGLEFERNGEAVYVLSPNYTSGQAPAICRRFLAVAAELLRDHGATSMRCESSGTAHSRERWLELAEAEDLVQAFVCMPIGDEQHWWSCGMHLLGRTDVIASTSGDLQETALLFDIFCNYLATECEHFSSGATFRCAPEQTRWRARWEPCRDYAEDEFYFNPFGRLRFAPIG